LDKFADEIHAAREENVSLKTKEGHYLSELQAITEERDKYRREYKSLKHKHRTLEGEFNEVSDLNYCKCLAQS
jgi:chromosome segregation ATPase